MQANAKCAVLARMRFGIPLTESNSLPAGESAETLANVTSLQRTVGVPMSIKEPALRFFEQLFNDADSSCAEEIAAAVYIEHAVAPFGHDAPGTVAGPEHLRETAAWLRAQFPDIHMTVESIVEEGDLVAVRVLSEGTNSGPLNGVIPPTGRRFSAAQSHWFRVEDGRLAEHWATREDLPTMIQLGVISPPGPPRPPAGT